MQWKSTSYAAEVLCKERLLRVRGYVCEHNIKSHAHLTIRVMSITSSGSASCLYHSLMDGDLGQEDLRSACSQRNLLSQLYLSRSTPNVMSPMCPLERRLPCIQRNSLVHKKGVGSLRARGRLGQGRTVQVGSVMVFSAETRTDKYCSYVIKIAVRLIDALTRNSSRSLLRGRHVPPPLQHPARSVNVIQRTILGQPLCSSRAQVQFPLRS